MCVENKTLVQQTDPLANNKPSYFKRNMKEYIDGFGFTNRELFLGLDTFYALNKRGNDEIFLTATMSNGTKFSTTFPNFQLEKEILDSYIYYKNHHNFINTCSKRDRLKYQYPNLTSRYVIKSVENNQFFFVHPNYVKPFTEKDEYIQNFRVYEDLHYASFTALDSDENQCALKSNTGWWFPLQYTGVRINYRNDYCGGTFPIRCQVHDYDTFCLLYTSPSPRDS